jgi:hypothetical protein
MAEYLHPVSILRKHFRYEPDTGWMFWRDMPFIEWAVGNYRAKQGHYYKWRREKAGKRVRFHFHNFTSVARLHFRSVTYTGPRLAWALHYGVHPEDDERVVTINGDSRDLSVNNLSKLSAREHYMDIVGRVRDARKSEYRSPQPSWMKPEMLRIWFDYDPSSGDIYWQHMGWAEWKRRNRGAQSSVDRYETYLHSKAETLVEFKKDRRGDQVISLRSNVYERKLLSYALKEGSHIPDICYLYHRNGDDTDFRWENIGMTYRDDVDLDAD